MKKLLKILGIVLGVLIIVIASAATYIHFKGIPTYDPPKIPETKVEITPERVAQGQKIAGLMCMHCHNTDSNRMTGKKLADLPPAFGEIYSMNITHDVEKGIGGWTDGELIYFLRTGLRKDGSYAPAYMPKFNLASDEDINSIVAWLRSDATVLQASKEEAPASKPSFLTKALSNLVPGFKPFPFPAAPVAKPDTTNPVAWGKYLADGLYACFACHSADFKTNNDLEPSKSEGFYGGGNTMLDINGKNEIKTKNLTPDATGLGSWSEEEFITAMRTGKRKNGKQMRYPMIPYTQLADGELKAIYTYLKTLTPITNAVAD